MICLHGEEACASITKKGILWHCNQPSTCHFFCTEEDEFIYDQGVKKFLATKQPQPLCCMLKGIVRNYAKMRVNTYPEDESFGRPFFVCSKKVDQCNYFAWGDQAIIPRPLCEHGKPCGIQKEWKEGPNKGRYFFSCAESYKTTRGPCKFFKWMEIEDQREIAEDTSAEFLRLNDEFPYYSDELLKLMAEPRAVALVRNEGFDIHQEYMEIIRTKELLEKRIISKEFERNSSQET